MTTSVLLVGFGQLEKEVGEYQKKAFYEGLMLMTGQKPIVAELFYQENKCFNTEDSRWLKDNPADLIKHATYVESLNHKSDCTINVTFKQSDLAPDLEGQVLTLKMVAEKDRFVWSCIFTGKNKKDLPNGCQ